MNIPSDINWARAQHDSLCTDSFGLLAKTNTPDGKGNMVETWALVSGQTAVACLIGPISGDEAWLSEKLRAESDSVLQFAATYTTITTRHRVRIGGIDYEVKYVDEPGSRQTAGNAAIARIS